MAYLISSQDVSTSDNVSVYLDDGTTRSISRYNSVYLTEEIPLDESVYNIDVLFDITKSDEDERLVSGWANVTVMPDGKPPLDWQDDIIATEVLEKAAINFMLDYRGSGEMHGGDETGTVVESIVLTKDKQAALGIPEGTVPEGWFITVKVKDPEVFSKVKKGLYKMFSIQGTAKRIEV